MRFDVAHLRPVQTPPMQADLNTQTVRGVFGFERAGQLRGSMAREEVFLGRVGVDFAYELTNGRIAGISWVWRGAFEYRVTSSMQATVSYDGRTEGGRPRCTRGGRRYGRSSEFSVSRPWFLGSVAFVDPCPTACTDGDHLFPHPDRAYNHTSHGVLHIIRIEDRSDLRRFDGQGRLQGECSASDEAGLLPLAPRELR